MKKIFCDWCDKETTQVINLFLEANANSKNIFKADSIADQRSYELCEECSKKIIEMIDS